MRIDAYKITDEPTPGKLSSIAVSPIWPFIAIMFGGAWLSWGWTILNGMAVGSPTFRRELMWVIAGIIGSAILLFVIFTAYEQGILQKDYLKYAILIVVAWKLGVAYVLFTLQSHTIELFEYFGGKLRNGIFVIIAVVLIPFSLNKSVPTFIYLIFS